MYLLLCTVAQNCETHHLVDCERFLCAALFFFAFKQVIINFPTVVVIMMVVEVLTSLLSYRQLCYCGCSSSSCCCCCCFVVVKLSKLFLFLLLRLLLLLLFLSMSVTMVACRSIGRQISALSKYFGSIRLCRPPNEMMTMMIFFLWTIAFVLPWWRWQQQQQKQRRRRRPFVNYRRSYSCRVYYLSFVFNLFMATVNVLLIMYIIIAIIVGIILYDMGLRWIGGWMARIMRGEWR